MKRFLPLVCFFFFILLLFSVKEVYSTTYTVTLTGGNAAPTANDGSFAGAILAVNANAASATVHRIHFNITGAAPYTINCTGMAATVTLNRNVVIDGTTQAGWVCGTPVIVLNGNGALTTLVLSGNTGGGLNALVIQRMQVQISGGNTNTVYGCFFGTNAAGTAASTTLAADQQLLITGSSSSSAATATIIGGTACGTRNVFSGALTGIAGNNPAVIKNVTSNYTSIVGNYIGTDKAGTTLLNIHNGSGIRLQGTCTNVTIGNNVIVGNDKYGIETDGTVATNNTNSLILSNNKIGINATGLKVAASFGNTLAGIFMVLNASNVSITGNTVSDNGMGATCTNTSSGIYIEGGMTTLDISNNYIGTDPNFNLAGNYFAGININGYVTAAGAASTNITVTGNYVGDNGKCPSTQMSHGIAFANMSNTSSTNIIVRGNYVGVTPSGADMGNWHSGVEFYEVKGFTLGGASAGQGNYIGFNKAGWAAFTGAGVQVSYNCTNGIIYGNYIGLAPNGTDNAGNKALGGYANSGAGINFEDRCSNMLVGGATAGQENKIFYNRFGVGFCGTSATATDVTTNSRIRSNTISSNTSHGIYFNRGNHVYIGGTLAGEGNVISNNGGNGINVAGSDYIQMRNNSIFCNTAKGINLNGASGNGGFAAPTITAALSAPTVPNQVNGGVTSANRIVEIYTTALCTSTCTAVTQGQNKLTTVTASAASTYSYTHGSTIFDYLSATATTAGCFNSILATDNCRTSEFSVCVSNTLPVELMDFSVHTLVYGTVKLEWHTATEINNDYFQVERSTDGINYVAIGQVKGAGLSSQIKGYQFTDEGVLKHQLYYRIKQVDINGDFAYTDVRQITQNSENHMKIYPNPNKGIFKVSGYAEASELTIAVYDSFGHPMYETTFENAEKVYDATVSLQNLEKGIYYVHVQTVSSIKIEKIIID